MSGIVTGRSGNTFTIDDATLLTSDGTNTLIFGTTTVTVGPNTQVTSSARAPRIRTALHRYPSDRWFMPSAPRAP